MERNSTPFVGVADKFAVLLPKALVVCMLFGANDDLRWSYSLDDADVLFAPMNENFVADL
jgi:hypothetical protein